MKESPIERYLVAQVKKIGGKAIKMLPTYENGMPDRQVLYEGRAVFVELKATGKKPRALQVAFSKELAKVGFEVIVIDSKQGVDALVADLRGECTHGAAVFFARRGVYVCPKCRAETLDIFNIPFKAPGNA